MTTAFGAVLLLQGRRNRFAGTVKVIFQPAEESRGAAGNPTGAVAVINTGALDDVEVFYGVHDFNEAEPGVFLIGPGPVSGAANKFSITVHGRGTHAARRDQRSAPCMGPSSTPNSMRSPTAPICSPPPP